MDETATFSDKMEGVGNQSGGQMKASRLLNRSQVWGRFIRRKISSFQRATGHKLHNTPLMTVLFATSTSILMYQNCSPAMESSSQSSNKNGVYSSTVGVGSGGAVGGGGTYAPGMGGGSGGTVGGVVPVEGGGSGSGGGGTGGSGGGSGTIPVDSGGGGSGGMVGGGNTGVNPGGSTGGSTGAAFTWQYQPEDRTVEEGDVLTLGTYATKGIDLVTYQWYKNGAAISGQNGYMLRIFQITTAAAGQYHVEARSGTDMIRSVTVTVRVKAARNPCPAGRWGFYPGTRNYNEYWHESMIGATNAPYRIQTELADSYTVRLPHASPGSIGGNCIEASSIFQCRNGKLINTDAPRCDRYYEGY